MFQGSKKTKNAQLEESKMTLRSCERTSYKDLYFTDIVLGLIGRVHGVPYEKEEQRD